MKTAWGLLYLSSGIWFGLTACHVIEPHTYDLEVACGFTAVIMVCDGLRKLVGLES